VICGRVAELRERSRPLGRREYGAFGIWEAVDEVCPYWGGRYVFGIQGGLLRRCY